MKNLILIRGLAVFISLYAVFVMVGWIFNIPVFTGILSGEINMKFSTALVFFLSGIALYFMAESFQNRKDMAQIVLTPITLVSFLIMATLNNEMMGKELHVMELNQKIENLKSKNKKNRKK